MIRYTAENKITIIIPSKLLDLNLKYCIKKIRNFYKKIKIIIILDEFQKKKLGKNITIITSGSKTIAFKRNLGVKFAKTPMVSFIDSDAYPGNKWLNFILDSFNRNKNISIVGGPNVSPSTSNIEKKLVANIKKKFFVTLDPKIKNKSNLEYFISYLPSVNLVIKKKIYQQIGGMNEKVNTGEDTLFMNMLKKKNIKVVFNGKAYVYHKDRNFKHFFRQRLVYGSDIIKLFFINPSKNTFIASLSLLPAIYMLIGPIIFLYSKLIFKLYLLGLIFLILFSIYYSLKINIKGNFFKSAKLVLISIFGPGLGFVLSLVVSSKTLKKVYTQR